MPIQNYFGSILKFQEITRVKEKNYIKKLKLV